MGNKKNKMIIQILILIALFLVVFLFGFSLGSVNNQYSERFDSPSFCSECHFRDSFEYAVEKQKNYHIAYEQGIKQGRYEAEHDMLKAKEWAYGNSYSWTSRIIELPEINVEITVQSDGEKKAKK
jgi:hypothetical protein